MPGMTGMELARQIRTHWPDMPVILASGYADLPNEEDPGWPRLSKPYQQDELAAAIARVFELVRSNGNVVPLDAARRA
jgi:CheY-like chemotaxis protein